MSARNHADVFPNEPNSDVVFHRSSNSYLWQSKKDTSRRSEGDVVIGFPQPRAADFLFGR
jgi:hypothetical protein